MTEIRYHVIAFALVSFCFHQDLLKCTAQVAGGARYEVGTIDANTRWAFRALSPVTVSSPIIRLGDVVKPLDPNMVGWQRLSRSPIGLAPLNGVRMTIQRDRLAQAIYDAEATPAAIDWIGPTSIRVGFRRDISAPEPASIDARQQQSNEVGNVIAQTAYDGPSGPLVRTQSPELSELEAKRIIYWITLALKRHESSIEENYEIEIDPDQPGLVPLKSIAGVSSITQLSELREGTCRFRVLGRSVDGSPTAEINVQLTRHPLVVVPHRSLSRGHEITADDLVKMPWPRDKSESDFVVDLEGLIGMEVRGTVRKGQPIRRSDVGPRTLIHRGELIEVRVIGGGVTVTTNAKSLRDGAESELIEIETLQPRRRLVARVVQPGLVEIVTRAPRLR